MVLILQMEHLSDGQTLPALLSTVGGVPYL